MMHAKDGPGRSVERGPGGTPSTPGSAATLANFALVLPPIETGFGGGRDGRTTGLDTRGGSPFIGPDGPCPRSFSCIFDIARDAEGALVGDSFSSSLGSVAGTRTSTEVVLLDPDPVAEVDPEPLVMVDDVADECI